jgi:hypothetical protein
MLRPPPGGSRPTVLEPLGYGIENLGVRVRAPVRERIFSSPRRLNVFWGPPSLLSRGYTGLFAPGVMTPRRETDHSPLTTAEVEKTWIYISTLPHVFVT